MFDDAREFIISTIDELIQLGSKALQTERKFSEDRVFFARVLGGS